MLFKLTNFSLKIENSIMVWFKKSILLNQSFNVNIYI